MSFTLSQTADVPASNCACCCQTETHPRPLAIDLDDLKVNHCDLDSRDPDAHVSGENFHFKPYNGVESSFVAIDASSGLIKIEPLSIQFPGGFATYYIVSTCCTLGWWRVMPSTLEFGREV